MNALKAGSATITATTQDGNKKAICAVIVNNAVVKPISISIQKSLSLVDGYSCVLVTSVIPLGAETVYTWKSSDLTIATVDKSGNITGKTEGITTITVSTDNGLNATCEVKVTRSLVDINPSVVSSAIQNISNLINKTVRCKK